MKSEIEGSVLRRPPDAVDDEHIHRRAGGVEFQAELLLQRGHELRPVRIWIRVLRRRELQRERVIALQFRAVQYRTVDPGNDRNVGEGVDQPLHWHTAGDQLSGAE